MPRYLISFDDGAMGHIRDDEWQEVSDITHAVTAEAKAAGVWIWGCGLQRQQATIVGTDGSVTPGPFPETKAVVGGFCILEVASHDEAVAWAKRLAVACRCAQEVREIMYDPES